MAVTKHGYCAAAARQERHDCRALVAELRSFIREIQAEHSI